MDLKNVVMFFLGIFLMCVGFSAIMYGLGLAFISTVIFTFLSIFFDIGFLNIIMASLGIGAVVVGLLIFYVGLIFLKQGGKELFKLGMIYIGLVILLTSAIALLSGTITAGISIFAGLFLLCIGLTLIDYGLNSRFIPRFIKATNIVYKLIDNFYKL